MDQRFSIWRYITPYNDKYPFLIYDNDNRDKTISSNYGAAFFFIENKEMDISFINEKINMIHSGGICFAFESRKTFNKLQKILEENSFELCGMFLLLPSRKEPRLLIPLTNKKQSMTGLGIYTPGKIVGRYKIKFLSFLAYSGLLRTFFNDHLVIGTNETKTSSKLDNDDHQCNTLTEFGKYFFKENITLAIHLGSRPRPEVKFTGQYIDENGEVISYLKLAESISGSKLLENEIKFLKTLESYNFTCAKIPKVLFEGKLNGSTLFLMSAFNEKISYNNKFTDKHIKFVIELFEIKLKYNLWIQSEVRSNLIEDMDFLCNYITDIDWPNVLSTLDKIFLAKEIPQGIAHRDFIPWNIKVNKNSLYIFDWEYASENCIPFWDVFNFLFNTIRKSHLNYYDISSKILFFISKNSLLIEFYERIFKTKELSYLNYLITIYCINYSALFLKNNLSNTDNLKPWLITIKQIYERPK